MQNKNRKHKIDDLFIQILCKYIKYNILFILKLKNKTIVIKDLINGFEILKPLLQNHTHDDE